MNYRVLAINPGSTSTKIAVFDDDKPAFTQVIRHDAREVASFGAIIEQYEWRRGLVEQSLEANKVGLKTLDAVVGRGGLLKGVASGTYTINEKILEDLSNPNLWGREHASNLGAFIAKAIGDPLKIPSFIVDPVTVDELSDAARISGVPEITRRTIFHALNVRYTARKLAEDMGKPLEEVNLIGVHMGGGITVSAIEKGRVVDVNTAVLGSGPFSPQRAGTLPLGEVLDMAYSGEYTKEELIIKFTKKSGLIGYLGTDDGVEIEERINNGDERAALILRAMCYQVSKEIGACGAALEGRIDGIFLTGGLAYSSFIVEEITRRTRFMAPVHALPGEKEMEALTQGAIRVLRGEEQAKNYGKTGRKSVH